MTFEVPGSSGPDHGELRCEVRAVADFFRAMSILLQDEGSTLDRLR